MLEEGLEVHVGPGVPRLVPRAIVLRGQLIVVEDGGDNGKIKRRIPLKLGPPVTKTQIAPTRSKGIDT